MPENHIQYSKDYTRLIKANTNEKIVMVDPRCKMIESFAFLENSEVKTVVLPPSVEVIANEAFRRSNIEKINIPNNCLILEKAFINCHYLKEVETEQICDNIRADAFNSCISLKHFNFKGVEELGVEAFFNCRLENVKFDSTLKYIRYGALANNNILSVVIPNSVIKIESRAFDNCSLKNIVFEGCPKEIDIDAFSHNEHLESILIMNPMFLSVHKEFCEKYKDIIFPNTIDNLLTTKTFRQVNEMNVKLKKAIDNTEDIADIIKK